MVGLVKDVAQVQAEATLDAYSATVPVDPRRIASGLGIVVSEVILPAGTSGIIRKRFGEDPVIMVHAAHSELRKRFTIAHEIGHSIERMVVQDHPDEDFGFVEARTTKHDVHEYFANEFAGNLLMPEQAVQDGFAENRSPIGLEQLFQVSADAMKTRLLKLGLLS